jgi:sirohydrochlorin cobaltochelatase
MKGLLLFAHGARDAAWARPFEGVAARLRAASPGTPLMLAYLEFMDPDIEAAAEQLVSAGCTEVEIVPMFLGTGGHVRRDIPPLLERLRERHGNAVRWTLQPPLGDHELVQRAMTDACLHLL